MAFGQCQNFVSAQYLVNDSLTNFAYALTLTRTMFGLLNVHFWQIYNAVMGLWWGQDFVSAKYLVNKSMHFDQILHMHCFNQI